MPDRPPRSRTATALRVAAMAAVVVLGLWAGPAPASAAPADDEAQFIALVNQARAAGGLGALSVHGELTAVGRGWAGSMAASGTLAHNPDLAGQVSAPWLVLGENVGRGGSVQAIFDALMASPSHRRNILDGRFTHIGVGVVYAGDGTVYTSHQFMQLGAAPAPAAAPAAAAPAPAPPPPTTLSPTTLPPTTLPPTTLPPTTLPPATIPAAERSREVEPGVVTPLEVAAPQVAADDGAGVPGTTTIALAGAAPLTVAYIAIRRRRSRRGASRASTAA